MKTPEQLRQWRAMQPKPPAPEPERPWTKEQETAVFVCVQEFAKQLAWMSRVL